MGSSVPASDMFAEVFFGLLALGFLLFLLPVFIAFRRRHPNRWPILIITIAFGATLIGWLVALVWALDWEDLDDPSNEDDEEYERDDFDDEDDRDRRISGGEPEHGHRSVQWASDQIERLARLRSHNDIDETEYQRLKAAVLDRLRQSNER